MSILGCFKFSKNFYWDKILINRCVSVVYLYACIRPLYRDHFYNNLPFDDDEKWPSSPCNPLLRPIQFIAHFVGKNLIISKLCVTSENFLTKNGRGKRGKKRKKFQSFLFNYIAKVLENSINSIISNLHSWI